MTNYAVELLTTWYEKHKDTFEALGAKTTFRDSKQGSAWIKIDTSSHLIDIRAWDHASCLDIEICEMLSEKFECPVMGGCESSAVFERHLEIFLAWFISQLCDTR